MGGGSRISPGSYAPARIAQAPLDVKGEITAPDPLDNPLTPCYSVSTPPMTVSYLTYSSLLQSHHPDILTISLALTALDLPHTCNPNCVNATVTPKQRTTVAIQSDEWTLSANLVSIALT